MLDHDQVLHVARLARLELTEPEVEKMANELSKVLDHIEKISELDLDVPVPCLPAEVALAQAPDPVAGGFGVPTPGAAQQ
jgi:aspartyl-tRNA(Asn)/glutamyl-tRNA(Gln) amidotransferase subunit C